MIKIYHSNMKHISLFSGIGGFDLAAEWMGWENVAHCEWNEFCQKILKYYWPNAISYEDITKTDFTVHRGTIDILTGGFPCQPYSVAGKRKGKDDERHLWPEMLRAIREIQPRWVVGENVRGLINWNGGLVFEEVQADLEAEGYKILPILFPAAGVGAPHRRDRIWFIAYSSKCNGRGLCRYESCIWNKNQKLSINCDTCSYEFAPNSKIFGGNKSFGKEIDSNGNRENSEHITQRQEIRNRYSAISRTEVLTNTDGFGLRGKIYGIRESEQFSEDIKRNDWENFPTQSPVCDGNDGISAQLDNITFSKWRKESIKGGGNAIVPSAALQIFKAIQEYETTRNLL